MSAKFCGKCGNELKEGAKFCPKCGWKVPSIQEGKKEVFNEPEEIKTTQNIETGKEQQREDHFSPNKQEEKIQSPIQEERVPPKRSQPPSSKEFNPYGKSPNVKSPFYGEQNKKAGRKTGIIVTIALSSIVIIVMTFLLITTLKGRSNGGQQGSTNNTVGGAGVTEVNGDNSATEGINGEWIIELMTDSARVNGKDSTRYKEYMEKGGHSGLSIDTGAGLATLMNEKLGVGTPMTLEQKGDQISFGAEAEGSRAEYVGTLSQNNGVPIIEGTWKSSADNSIEKIEMEGRFVAEKLNPLIPEELLSQAVSISGEELQGIYKGSFTYTKFINLDKAPDALIPKKEAKRLLDLKDQSLDCKIEVEEGEMEVFATVPELGEFKMVDIDLENLQEGILKDMKTEAGDEEEGTKRAAIRTEVVTLKEGGNNRIFGVFQISAKFLNGEDLIVQSEFDGMYEGPVAE